MSILTKEGIQKILNDDWLLMDDCEGLENCTVIKELARMALAAMDSEPVAEVVSIYGDPEAFGEREIRPLVGIQQMPYGTKLYRHAQPAPEYPETLPCPVLLEPGLRFGKGIKTSTMLAALARRAVHESDMAALSPEERAEFQVGIEDVKALIAQPVTVVPDGYVMVPKDLLSELRDWAHPEIEKYCEMWEGRRDSEFPALRKVIADADALLASAPQEVKDVKAN